MKRIASLKGTAVRVVRYESTVGCEERSPLGSPLGLRGEVVWDEGGEEVVVAFDREVGNGGFATDHKNQAWIYRAWLEQLM